MTATPHPARLSAAALLTAVLAATPAFGQVQVQQGGALDANQQVGSGGYNPTANQVDYRARNLLITGEVGGGRAFQGNVGYTAPGAFQGSLGSDSLFNFRRDSIYSAPGGSGFRVQDYGDRVIVTRPTTSLTEALYNPGYDLSNRTSYDPASGTVSFRQSGGGLVAVTGISDSTSLNQLGSSLGLVSTPQGFVRIDASPLTGIRYNPLDVNTGNDLSPLNNRALDAQLQPELIDLDDEQYTPGQLPGGQNAQPGETEDGTLNLNLIEDPLTISLGTQVQSALALQLAGRTDNNIPNSQAQAIRGQLFGQVRPQQPGEPGVAPKAPENPYDKLIADILAQASGQEPADEGGADDAGQPEVDDRPRWQQILEEPEQEILDSKRKAREVALRMSLGMVDEQGNVDYSQKLPTIDPDSELGKLLSDLDYKLPRVTTLAGKDENRINNLLTRGEQELKAGKYTMAESIYRQILRENSGDPLAKAGLIHSQMGAGMIRSSAFNLRSLFSDHPELIALRYDTKLLPDTERLRWLQGRLQKQIADDNPGSEPGLILAYLGYQLEAKPLIEFGLAVAESEAPRDPLMPVLRRIWLEGEDAGADAEAGSGE